MPATHQDLIALLHRANQIATERFADALRGSDLTARQVQVLAAIDEHDGASQTALGLATGIDRSTLADIVRRLQQRRLIERRRTKQDARAYAVRLTDAGRARLADGRPALAAVEKGMLAKLPARERTQLLALLAAVVAG